MKATLPSPIATSASTRPICREIPQLLEPDFTVTHTDQDDSFTINIYKVFDVTDPYHPFVLELVSYLDGTTYIDRHGEFSDLYGAYWRSRWALFDRLKQSGKDINTGLGLIHTRMHSPFYMVEGEFEFNEHNVCVNTKSIVVEGENYKVEFRLAQSPTLKWGCVFGYDYHNGGRHSPLVSQDCIHETEESALQAQIKKVKARFPEDKKLLTNLAKYTASRQQLSLF